jgi:predicted NBD/HSP70 family sugar kinase
MTPERTVRARSRNPGSQTALRASNQQRIIRSLVTSGSLTQAELSRRTGLSTATVSNIVKAMSERGMVTTEPTTSSGRRALSVSLIGGKAVSVGVDFGRTHVRVIVSTIGFETIAEDAAELPLGQEAGVALSAGAALLHGLLESNGIERSSVLGVGVGIPGPIDRRAGTVVDGYILPAWVGITREEIADRLGFPVFIDNDANLGALAELTWGPFGTVSNLVFVKIGSGIGAGLVLDGELFTGHIGVTGEIGHTPIHDHGLVCSCGNRGCLETVASTTIMIELLRRTLGPAITTADIIRHARANEASTVRVVHDAGFAVGRAIANIANLINPEVVVIGGPLAALGDLLLDPIRQGFDRYAVPSIAESTRILMSALGDRAEALGAAALALQQSEVHAPGM